MITRAKYYALKEENRLQSIAIEKLETKLRQSNKEIDRLELRARDYLEIYRQQRRAFEDERNYSSSNEIVFDI